MLSIGQAGERKELLSAIIADARAAARGGVGAVMGSKNLKAISVLGSKRPELHDQKAMMTLVKEQNARLNKNPVTNDALRHRGTVNILLASMLQERCHITIFQANKTRAPRRSAGK